MKHSFSQKRAAALRTKTLHSLARGFTLIELVVVVAILGVLIAIVAPNVIGTKDGANSKLMLRAASNIATNWSLLNQACGTATVITGSVLPGTGKNAKDVIFTGSASVAAAYTNCYSQSKILPLTELSASSGSGTYNVGGYDVSFGGGGTSPLTVTYAAVPDTLVLLMVQNYLPSVSALAAGADATSPVITYGAPTSGARSVTIIKQI